MRFIPAALPVVVALLLAGCETAALSTRIEEKAELFARLTPEQQRDIRAGVIEVGYTTDMVYMALGRPGNIAAKDTPEGPVAMWTYRNFHLPNEKGFSAVADQHQQWRADKQPGKLDSHPTGSQKEISSTFGGLQTSLNVPELISKKLFVQFFNGRVFLIKLENG